MRATTISTSVEIGLRFVGIWPGLPYGSFTWFTYMSSVAVVLYFQYAYIFGHFNANDVSNLIDALSNTLAYSLTFLKLFSLWSNRRTFYNILLTMNEDWSNVNRDRSVLCAMTDNANLSRRCSNILITINIIAATCYAAISLIHLSTVSEENLNVSLKVLPIKMELPFEVNATPFFELLVAGVFLHEVSVATLNAVTISLILSLVLHVSGQIDILRRDLLTICDSGSPQRDSNVKLLTIQHQRIITFSDNIEELYSNIALMQFLSNTVVICCIGLTLINALDKDGVSVLLLKSVSFYIAITLEAFIFCFAGEYLSAKSKSIGDAAYESLWYNMTPTVSRILMLIMLRSQKRLTITAGNVMDLSLEAFTVVMKASASYMSVLHAMY
nr:PREDICTED: odorant receptor 85b-like [Linepithema humile]